MLKTQIIPNNGKMNLLLFLFPLFSYAFHCPNVFDIESILQDEGIPLREHHTCGKHLEMMIEVVSTPRVVCVNVTDCKMTLPVLQRHDPSTEDPSFVLNETKSKHVAAKVPKAPEASTKAPEVADATKASEASTKASTKAFSKTSEEEQRKKSMQAREEYEEMEQEMEQELEREVEHAKEYAPKKKSSSLGYATFSLLLCMVLLLMYASNDTGKSRRSGPLSSWISRRIFSHYISRTHTKNDA